MSDYKMTITCCGQVVSRWHRGDDGTWVVAYRVGDVRAMRELGQPVIPVQFVHPETGRPVGPRQARRHKFRMRVDIQCGQCGRHVVARAETFAAVLGVVAAEGVSQESTLAEVAAMLSGEGQAT